MVHAFGKLRTSQIPLMCFFLLLVFLQLFLFSQVPEIIIQEERSVEQIKVSCCKKASNSIAAEILAETYGIPREATQTPVLPRSEATPGCSQVEALQLVQEIYAFCELEASGQNCLERRTPTSMIISQSSASEISTKTTTTMRILCKMP